MPTRSSSSCGRWRSHRGCKRAAERRLNTLAVAPGKICVHVARRHQRRAPTSEVGLDLLVVPSAELLPRPWRPALHEHAIFFWRRFLSSDLKLMAPAVCAVMLAACRIADARHRRQYMKGYAHVVLTSPAVSAPARFHHRGDRVHARSPRTSRSSPPAHAAPLLLRARTSSCCSRRLPPAPAALEVGGMDLGMASPIWIPVRPEMGKKESIEDTARVPGPHV